MVVDNGQGGDQPTTTGTTPFTMHNDGEGINIKGWVVRNEHKAIMSSAAEESLSRELDIKLPGMLFDRSFLQLSFDTSGENRSGTKSDHRSPSFELAFRAIDALTMVGESDPNIKVKAAERWDSKTERSDVEITTIEKASDWTFSTRYPGTVKLAGDLHDLLSPKWVPCDPAQERSPEGDSSSCASPEGIDYDALRNTDLPILFSAQVILFEDELDDNGTASYKVRIRVMPSFFFILARFFLRVDGVLIRIYDTRYFHRFGTDKVIRETVTREANIETTFKGVHMSLLRDPDLAAQRMPAGETKVENIRLLA